MQNHRQYQLLVSGEYFDSFNNFYDAIAASKNHAQISIVDSYDGVVVYEDAPSA
jgi:hypothetical protein